GLASTLSSGGADAECLRNLGKLIGEALIAFDCAADWHHDIRYGHFNPLRTAADVHGALEYAQASLEQARLLSSRTLGHASGRVKILAAVKERVTQYGVTCPAVTACQYPTTTQATANAAMLLPVGPHVEASSGDECCCGIICCCVIGGVILNSCCGE